MHRFLVLVFLMSSPHVQTRAQEPNILGLAHVAFRVSDMGKTGTFYKIFLGYEEPFSVGDEKTTIALVKVNDQQYVELLQGNARSQGQLDHFALYTDDLTAIRGYLQAKRVPLTRDIHQGRIGNPFLTVLDPDGHPIEIVQYSTTSLTGQSGGNFMPASRISNHITHVGILVRSVGSALKFYRDILGFRAFSRGGGQNGKPAWIDLRARDGSDYIELIPFADVPSPADLKAQNHLGLATSDVKKTVAGLKLRATGSLLNSSITIQTGDNLPPSANVFDPDGARIELMEPFPTTATLIGQPTSGR